MPPRYIDVTLDKPRRLRFDVNALDDLERALGGMTIGTLVVKLRDLGVSELMTVVWCGLKHEDKSLTRQRVGNLMDAYFEAGHDFNDLAKLAGDAIEASGIVKKEDDAAVPAPDPLTPVG